MKNRILLLCGLLLMNSVAGSYKIVFLISPPRSLSTAFLRMMQARGDFSIMNEPSLPLFLPKMYPELFEAWNKEGDEQGFSDFKKAIFEKAETHNVFVKEISFMIKDFLLADPDFIKNPNVYFVFLVRNPHHTAISFYKASQAIFHITRSRFSELYGYHSTQMILEMVKKYSVNPFHIICAEDLYAYPQQTVQKFCDCVGIAYTPEALNWDNLGTDFLGQQWNEKKKQDALHHWHGDAIASTGFGKPSTYEVDATGQPTFSEITDLEHQAICKKAYLEQLSYYDLLLRYKN